MRKKDGREQDEPNHENDSEHLEVGGDEIEEMQFDAAPDLQPKKNIGELTKSTIEYLQSAFKKKIPNRSVQLDHFRFKTKDKVSDKHSFVVSQPHGIEIWDTVNGAAQSKKVISSAVINSASKIHLKGFEKQEISIYKVELDNGQPIVSDKQTLAQTIGKTFYVHKGYEREIELLIESTIDKIENMYYAPGYWVNNHKIEYALEAGYNPPWKESIKWVPKYDTIVSDNDKRIALLTLKEFIGHYQNPKKASAVFCYAVLAPLAQYIKQRTNYFPHLIIQGLQSTGKSTLLDYLKLLYSINWTDATPKSEYQARRLLAQTTIPALIDEMRAVFSNQQENSALEVLHTAATTEMLRTAGGGQYGGIFLAIRTLIGCTNADLTLVPFQADKFISVTISKADALITEKAKGTTPRTMTQNIKMAVPVLFHEALMILENEMESYIDQLARGNREEIRLLLIGVGYRVWQKLYEKYNAIVFDPPLSKDGSAFDEESKDATMQYAETFLSYIQHKLQHKQLGFVPMLNGNLTSTLRLHKQNFEKLMVLAVFDGQEHKYQIICKPSYLTHFSTYALKEYSLPYIGWQRLHELLDMKITSVVTDPTNKAKKETVLVYTLAGSSVNDSSPSQLEE